MSFAQKFVGAAELKSLTVSALEELGGELNLMVRFARPSKFNANKIHLFCEAGWTLTLSVEQSHQLALHWDSLGFDDKADEGGSMHGMRGFECLASIVELDGDYPQGVRVSW